ncbi:DUF4437 domain-containing protein [Flagellimonas sp. CMM7]|uniref:DUF4437 domain-containing protein n=1 Tax=Flagellimonas sp. CMM7 TaxID=2654676 RepID=UPI0013D6BF88|nr:DUF4437 domain-containing protein [Flagellimonas sp. CMM7]UII79018.1 DUF4437 domain-containing protein [Flagellimonas sp. CMM7]
MTIDFKHKRFYFKPNSRKRNLNDLDFGFTRTLKDEKLIVGFVWDEELKNKLSYGDEILEINGKTANICNLITKDIINKNDGTLKMKIKKHMISLVIIVTTITACKTSSKNTSVLPSFPTEVQIATNEIKFGEFTTGINGGAIEAATVEGMLNGAHGTFVRIPVGEETVSHTQSNTYHGIVVKGIVENPVNGNTNPKRLPAGSFWYQPGEQEHITRCSEDSEEPCVVFIFQTENFDFIQQ